MEKKNDGGPAFPFNRDSSYEQLTPEEEGMSLRDYFAGQALLYFNKKEVREIGKEKDLTADEIDGIIASASYSMADAMIIQRDK